MNRTTTAAAWIGGGLLWTLAGLVHGGSYEALWLPADALILIGISGLWFLGLHRTSTLGQVGLAVALAGRIVFIVAEILSIAQGDDNNVLLPLGAISSAVGLTAYGIAVVRAHSADGPLRFAPLTTGVYPFVVMFPILAARGGDPSDVAIALWGIPTALLGLALVASARSVRSSSVASA